MSLTSLRQPKKSDKWPHKVTVGRVTVKVYKRLTPAGKVGFRVENYSTSQRRLDSYSNEADAMAAANRLARQLSQRDVIGASMTREQSIEYASANQALQPLGLSLNAAVSAIVQAVTETGSLSAVSAAVQFYKAKHTPLVEKLVADVVAELIENKKATGKGARHITGLQFRLGKFTEAFRCNISDVTSAQIQMWLENQKTSANSYQNNRAAIHLLFNFALHKHRPYVRENVVADVEKRDVPPKDVEVFTPEEAQKLLASVKEDFLPCLAIGLFAGIRGSEIQRLTWEDVYLQRPARERQIFVKARNAKTGDSRNAQLTANLAAWLASYAERKGRIWSHSIATYITRLRETSQDAGIKWKKNGLRDSFISYACAITKDIGRVRATADGEDRYTHIDNGLAAEIRGKLGKAVELMPSFGSAHQLYGVLELVQGQYWAEAGLHLLQAVQLEPENPSYLMSLAQYQYLTHNFIFRPSGSNLVTLAW